MDTKKPLIGKRGVANIFQIYTSISNSDSNDGSGHDAIDGFWKSQSDAEAGAIGTDVMGTDGKTGTALAIKFEDGTMFLLNEGQRVHPPLRNALPYFSFSTHSAKQSGKAKMRAARTSGLAKLTDDEKKALELK